MQAQVENDGLALDDVRSAVIRVRKDTPVLLVNGRPFGARLDQSAEWLRVALNPFEANQTPPANVTARPTVVRPTEFAGGTGKGDLTPYDCVFLCDVPSLTTEDAKRLEAFVRRGGGLVVCLGDQVQAKDYNEYLYRGGSGLLPAPLVGPRSGNAAYNLKLSLDADWDRDPPLKAFSGASDQISLLAPRFTKYFELGESKATIKPRRVLGLAPELIPGKEAEARGVAPPAGGPFILDWQPPGRGGRQTNRRRRQPRRHECAAASSSSPGRSTPTGAIGRRRTAIPR